MNYNILNIANFANKHNYMREKQFMRKSYEKQFSRLSNLLYKYYH